MAGINTNVRAPKQQRATAAGAEGSVDERHFSRTSSRRIIEGEPCWPSLPSFLPIRRVHACRADAPLVERAVRALGATLLACPCGAKFARDHVVLAAAGAASVSAIRTKGSNHYVLMWIVALSINTISK